MMELTFNPPPSRFSVWLAAKFWYSLFDNLQTILNYAKDITRANVGNEVFNQGMIATPTLILCDIECDQGLHLDTVGENTKQFGIY